MGIFGGYDVRGVYGKDVNENAASDLGRAFASFLGNKGSVVVGRDPRLSSPSLSRSLLRGLNAGGVDVFDIGLAPTPVVYFAGVRLKADATVSVTASHNPPQYAGFKFCRNDMPLSSEELLRLKKLFEEKKFVCAKTRGAVVEKNISGDYAEYVVKKSAKARLKVVVDTGNGSCGPVAMRIFEKMGCNAIGMFIEPDGTFPNHLADPHDKRTLVQLQERVRKEKADLGIAFDGDGDRVYFVDENGSVITPDAVAVLFAREVLKKNKGATLPFELRCSMVLREEIEKNGGRPLMVAAGRVAVREAMARAKAPFGTESTGHVCFGENRGFDDGLFAAAKFASILFASRKKASALVASVPKYFASVEYRLTVPVERKNSIVAGVKTLLAKNFKLNELDGVRVEADDYWGLLRASNTEPKITLRFEGKTRVKLEDIYSVFSSALKKEGVRLPPLEVD